MSKVWNNMHDRVADSCHKSLSDLQLDYLDAYFVHWPFPNYHPPHCNANSRDLNAKPFSVDVFMNTWQQMEYLVYKGWVRHIGMSNMTIPKLESVLPLCKIKPSLIEMELHPSFQQPQLFNYCISRNILPVGFCPIGSPHRPERDRTPEDINDLEIMEVIEIAKAHKIHPAVVCLKWAIQRGQIPIPFSVFKEELSADLLSILEDPLSRKEMDQLRKVDKNCRLIKGQVFLWPGADSWTDIWDVDGYIAK
jgi:alcohol dehydrogenase (NADP+)